MSCMVTVSAVIVRMEVPRANELPPQDVAVMETVKQEILQRRKKNLRSLTERRLDPAWCDKACRGVVFPYCQIWHPECYNHRRRLDEMGTNSTAPYVPKTKLRELQGADCEAEKELIRYELEQAVSPSSIPVLDESEMACFEISDFCEIDQIDLWNAANDTMQQTNIVNGASICKGDHSLSFGAITDTCVTKVTFVLTGATNFFHTRNEYNAPYFLYGNVGTSISGEKLPVGSYTLVAIPDDNDHLSKRITFSIANC